MKIAILIHDLNLEGIAQMVTYLTSTLTNHEFIIICNEVLSDPGVKNAKIYELKKKIKHKASFNLLNLIRETSKIIRKEKPDLIHLQDIPLILRVKNFPKKRTICTIHRSYSDKGIMKKIFQNILSRKIRYLISVGRITKQSLKRNLGISQKKIKLVMNGIDLDKFNNKFDLKKIRKDLGLKKNEKVMSIIAGIREEKDHLTLIRAFKKIVYTEQNVKLLIVGGGLAEQVNKIRKEIADNGLTDKVKLLGERRDIDKLLGITDISVLSSRIEALPMTLLESMASSNPIVATSVGGNSELIVDGVNGFLVPPKNPSALASALLRLLSDSKLRSKMGKEGRKRVEKYFSTERMCKEYEQIYESILPKTSDR